MTTHKWEESRSPVSKGKAAMGLDGYQSSAIHAAEGVTEDRALEKASSKQRHASTPGGIPEKTQAVCMAPAMASPPIA